MTYVLIAFTVVSGAYTATTIYLLSLMRDERDKAREERQRLHESYTTEREGLLNRIQAPEAVVTRYQTEEITGEPQYVPTEDDTALEEHLEAQRNW